MPRKVLIQIRRGTEAELAGVTLAPGELGFTTDTQKLYIGTPTGNVLLVNVSTAGDMLKSIYDTDNDGRVDAAEVADSVPWTGVMGKPSTFTPAPHTHSGADITSVVSEADTVDGKHADDLMHFYVADIDDTVSMIPVGEEFFLTPQIAVVNSAYGQGPNFAKPTVWQLNEWDWTHRGAWAIPPALPQGYSKLYAKVTLHYSADHWHGMYLYLRREFFDTSTGTWKKMDGDPDIYLGHAQASRSKRGDTSTFWVPWWTTQLQKMTRGGPTQRLLIAGHSDWSGDAEGAFRYFILGAHFTFYPSKTNKTQTWSTGETSGAADESFGLWVGWNQVWHAGNFDPNSKMPKGPVTWNQLAGL
ncbi:MAG: hypothetical protein IMX00_04180 [Limnochordales bacterium]|nr:hypothetical protein [Limnochordales bacterium]